MALHRVGDEGLRELAYRTPALLFSAGADGRIDFVNSRWTDLVGVSEAELLGFGWTGFVHPNDVDAARSLWSSHVESGQPLAVEVRLRRVDGVYRWIELQAIAERDNHGIVRRWHGAGIDVDAQRRAFEAVNVLAQSGESVAAATSIESVLEQLALVALEGLADIAIFDVRNADGTLKRYATAAAGVPEAAMAAVRSFPPPATDSAHPIARSISERRTVVVSRVDAAYLTAAVADPVRRQRWIDAGIRSMIVAPLQSAVGEREFGALTLLRTRQDVPFIEADVRVVEDVGRRTALALDRARLLERVSDEEQQHAREFRVVADLMPELMYINAAGGGVQWYNARWFEYTGQTRESALDRGWEAVIHPDDLPEVNERWAACVATGSPFEMEFRMRRHDGVYRWFIGRAVPVRDVSGNVVRWYGTNTDIDENRRATTTAQVFAGIGDAVTTARDLPGLLDTIMHVVVPAFADWSYITLADEAGDLRVAATYHGDPRKRAQLATQIGNVYARGNVPTGSPFAVRSGEAVLYRDAGYDDAANVANMAVVDAFWQVGFHSVLVIPLIVGTQARGTIVMCMAETPRKFDPVDIPFFQEVAKRIAPAIANAELYERERRVAKTFQEAALPATLPAAQGFQFDAIYEAGRAEALVGGDWYDAFRLVDGRLVVSIGDVAGSGLQSAVTMASVRQAIRGVAQVHADPELMLEAADRALRTESPDRFVTAFVGVIDPVSAEMSYRSAGHPAPFMRTPDGTIDALPLRPSAPLGLRERQDGDSHVVPLAPGALLVFYTDGLIESTRDVDEGQRRLRAALDDPRVHDADRPALAVHDAVLVEGSRDDVAILTVRVTQRAASPSWMFPASDEREARRARDGVVAELSRAGYPEVHRSAFETIFAELIGNLVRHAPGQARVVLEWEGGRPVLHILDRGPGYAFAPRLPQDVFSESGRGLFLITALTEDFHVSRRPTGGSHARVVLRV